MVVEGFLQAKSNAKDQWMNWFKKVINMSGEELEQGLRLMNLIDHKERRRAWELRKLSTARAQTSTGWPINRWSTLT
jgi:hypothetical protein